MNRTTPTLFLIPCAAFFSGCWVDFDYRYMSLAGSMEVLEYGKADIRNLRDHADMPIRYKLEREGYVIYALVNTRSYSPTVILSVEGKSLIDARIKGTGIPCYLFIDKIRPSEFTRHGYPAGSVRFVWVGMARPLCADEKTLLAKDRIIRIAVFNGIGDKVAEEEIPFDIVTNGIHREYDSL